MSEKPKSPRGGRSLHQHVHAEQRISFEAEETVFRSKIVGLLSLALRNQFNPDKSSIIAHIPFTARNGLQSLLARKTIAHLALNKQLIERLETTDGDTTVQILEGLIRDQIDTWFADTSGGKFYQRGGHKDTVVSEEEEATEEDTLPLKLYTKDIEKSFGIRKRLYFDRVRSADYVTVTPENAPNLLPKIERSYEKSVIKSKDLELLLTDYPKYCRRTKNGLFVFHMHEQPMSGDGESLLPSAYTQLSEGIYEEESQLRVKCLIDHYSERLLAWMSYYQAPSEPSNRHREKLHAFLKHGVTGGEMNYSPNPHPEQILSVQDRVQYIDTIQGNVPFAANRLFSKALEDMKKEHDDLYLLIGYRLHSINLEPSIISEKHPIRYTENPESARFFHRLNCTALAFDHSASAPYAIRLLFGDQQKKATPSWLAMSGHYEDIRTSAHGVWRGIQHAFGDITKDGLSAANVPVVEHYFSSFEEDLPSMEEY